VLTPTACADLRELCRTADYTVDGVIAAIGAEAHRALGRNSTVPGERALAGRDDPLATMIGLFLLQLPVPRAAVAAAFPGLDRTMIDSGLLETDGETVRAVVDLRPYATDGDDPYWVVADLTPGMDTMITPIRPDYVLGVSSASTTLAQLTVRRPVGRALDLGTGCGVQSLHLAGHADQVVGTDLNPRALELARLTLSINGVDADLRQGDLLAPVAGERFDLIISNPPYVMAPPTTDGRRLTYREGTRTADGLVEELVRAAPRHLTEGGICQILANWAHPSDGDWAERLTGWIDGCDAHVVQREVLDPGEYVELWLADAGKAGRPGYRADYTAWLDYLSDLGIAGIGMGWITLRRTDAEPDLTIEEWPHGIEQPIGPAIAARLDSVAAQRELTDAELLDRHWTVAEDVTEESLADPGGADPRHIVLRQARGFRRAVEADTALAGVVGACDGELPLGRIIDAVAQVLEIDSLDLRAESTPRLRGLIRDGFLRWSGAERRSSD
jgi:methylase of polypeptide subunit release factors